jgi:uncharacterized ion transporter superfamily protein YfcC
MFPALMTIFAIGGSSYGMAEETLAFYALIITVMLAAGYDGLSAGALILLGAGIGVLGSTVNPFATGIASGFADTTISEGIDRARCDSGYRHGARHPLCDALCREGEKGSVQVADL